MITVRPLLPSIVMLALLAGCVQLTEGPSGDASLNLSTVHMLGVTSASVQITAEGAWTLETGAVWLSANPDRGTGDATVTLNVDAGGLTPGEYSSIVTLKPKDHDASTTDVVFAFPRLRGSLVPGPAGTLSTSLLSAQSLPAGPGTLLVGLREPASTGSVSLGSGPSFPAGSTGFRSLAADLASSRRGMSLRSAFPNSKIAVIETDDMRSAGARLLLDPNVRYVEPERFLELQASDDPHRVDQWALDLIRVDDAWAFGDGTGIRVAVIDAGFHPDHPDLSANITETYDFVSGSSVIPDHRACGAHGDHVSGIIAAVTNNLEGVAGIAPDARLALLNVGSESEDGEQCLISTSSVVEALEWVIGNDPSGAARRAEIVNMSLGGGYTSALEDAVKAAYAAGITMVAAAGNSPQGSVLYPAAFPQVIAVSSTGRSDEIASYSTTGPQIFVSAPGGNDPNILSTYYLHDAIFEPYTYGEMAGTSMASPAVAAVAAIVKSVNPDLSPLGVAGLLADTSVDLLPAGRDPTFGYGRIDAAAAASRASAMIGEPTGYLLQAGSKWEYGVPVEQQFEVGYIAGGPVTLKVGTDDDLDGNLGELGEYYGELATNVTFDGPFFDVEIEVQKVE